MRARYLLLAVPFLVFSACEKNPIDTAIDTALDAALDLGEFEALDGLVITVEGNTGTVTSMGDSPMGSNPSVFSVGDEFIRNLRITDDENRWEGEVVVPEFGTGGLTRISYGPAVVTVDGRALRVSGGGSSYSDWFPVLDPATLTSAAACEAYWKPILIAGSPWEVIYYNSGLDGDQIGNGRIWNYEHHFNQQTAMWRYETAWGPFGGSFHSYAFNYHFSSPSPILDPWCRITGYATIFPIRFSGGELEARAPFNGDHYIMRPSGGS